MGRIDVGSYRAGAFGLHDLAGNVWEFLLDEWQEEPNAEMSVDPVAGGAVSGEALASVTGRRAVRGGSFGGGTVNLRTRWRDSHEVTNAVEHVGFRCAYPANPQ